MLTALAFALQAAPQEADLTPIIEKLKAVSSVSYDYKRTLDYPSDGYKHIYNAQVFILKSNEAPAPHPRFQITSDHYSVKYDGLSLITKSPESSGNQVNTSPNDSDFTSLSGLKNTPYNLEKALVSVQKSNGVKISLLPSARLYYRYKIELQGLEITPNASLEKVSYNPTYVIDFIFQTGLPAKIVQTLKDPRDTIVTEFTNYNLSPTPPPGF